VSEIVRIPKDNILITVVTDPEQYGWEKLSVISDCNAVERFDSRGEMCAHLHDMGIVPPHALTYSRAEDIMIRGELHTITER